MVLPVKTALLEDRIPSADGVRPENTWEVFYWWNRGNSLCPSAQHQVGVLLLEHKNHLFSIYNPQKHTHTHTSCICLPNHHHLTNLLGGGVGSASALHHVSGAA